VLIDGDGTIDLGGDDVAAISVVSLAELTHPRSRRLRRLETFLTVLHPDALEPRTGLPAALRP
jgi:hypothetical protein